MSKETFCFMTWGIRLVDLFRGRLLPPARSVQGIGLRKTGHGLGSR